jgi:outer membrane receptor protein involved in Fe transport
MGSPVIRGAIAALLLASVLMIPNKLVSQTTADIVGIVTDTSGASVPGATVLVTNLETGETRTQTTGAGGEYSITTLPVGHYRVKIQLQGFKTWTAPDITLALGDRLRLAASLAVGGVDQTVEVVGQTPALRTDSSSTGTLIPATSVQNLPLNGRNFVTLVQLSAGAADSTVGFADGTDGNDRRLTSQVQVNGQYAWSNNFLIDGMDNNERFIGTITVKPSIESIQEMNVTTSNYSADLGRTAGGVINMITKSGTNNYHGSAYEYFRNQVLDARNFFARTGPKPAYRQNQYGGSLGGPIVRDKSFFFLDYEALRLSQATITISTVPLANGVAPIQPDAALATAAGAYNGVGGMRTGNFTGIAPIYDPINGHTQFPGNVIPSNRQDKAGIALINLYPLPNNGPAGTLTNNYLSAPTTTNDEDTMDVRFDNKFNANNSAYLRYTYANIRVNIPGATPPVANGSYTNESTHGLGFDFLHTFTPRLLVEIQAGWSRFLLATLPGSYGQDLTAKLLGIPNINISAATSNISQFSFTDGSLSSAGDQFYTPKYNTNDTFEINGNVLRQIGSHNFKFGGVDRFRMDTYTQQPFATGRFMFSTIQTASSASGQGSGYGVASLALGYPNSATSDGQLSIPQYRFKEFALYAMDDWRATKWLTLNLGVRYEYYGPLYTANNEISNFNFATNQLQTAGTGSYGSNAGVTMGKLNFSPRLGFAATVTKHTVVRGGFATSYVPFFMGTYYAFQNAPFISQFSTITGQFYPNFSLTNTNPQGGPNSSAAATIPTMPAPTAADPNNPFGPLDAVSPHLDIPYVYQTNLAVQQQIGANTATVTYVGVFGRQQPWPNNAIDINQPTPGPQATNQQRRPYNTLYPNVQQIMLYGNSTTNSYNGLQASLERRLTKGLEAVANYTYAHAIDNFEYQPLVNSQILAHPFGGYRLITGNSEIDLRNRLTAFISYKVGAKFHGFLGGAVNNWGLNAIFQAQSGLPFMVTNSTDVAGTDSEGGNRPNRVGDYTRGGSIDGATNCPANVHNSNALVGSGNLQWLNTCAFAVQPAGTFGNDGRYAEYGPHETGLNFAAGKEFAISERLHLQIRGELFNAFNHPVFGLPAATLGGGGFGQVSSTAQEAFGLPRNVQLAAKFTF